MNGMKGAFLILALIAGVALAVPANPPASKDAAEPAKPAAADAPPAEAPAKIEEAAKGQPPKPASNATARAAAEGAKKPSGDAAAAPAPAPKEEKIEPISFELPIGNGGKSAEGQTGLIQFPNIEQIVGAPKPASSAEQTQGDVSFLGSFEVIQGGKPIAEAPLAPATAGIVDAKDAGFGAPAIEQFPQPAPSAEQEREKIIDEMIEKLMKLKSMGPKASPAKSGN